MTCIVSKISRIGVALIGALTVSVAVQTTNASAHPHVWVTVETEIEQNQQSEITGFRHKWTFDEYYTSFATTGLDTNGDGAFSREELRPLAQTNVESLAEFGYFTYPSLGGNKVALKQPVNYHLEYTNNLLTLYFTLPLETPVPAGETSKFSFQVYDPGYYVAMTFAKKDPVRMAASQPAKCAPVVQAAKVEIKQASFLQALGENIDPASNIGASFADKVELRCP